MQWDLRFRVGIAGIAPGERQAAIRAEGAAFLSELLTSLAAYNIAQNGFSGAPAQLDFFTSSLLADGDWMEWLHQENTSLHVVEPGAKSPAKLALGGEAATVSRMEPTAQIFETTQGLVEWVAGQIDLAIVLWDGDVSARAGWIWAFIQECRDARIPCLWIHTHQPDTLRYYRRFFFEPYAPDKLADYLEDLYRTLDTPLQLAEDAPPREPRLLSRLWSGFYQRFMRRHQGESQAYPAEKPEPELREDYIPPASDARRQENHRVLVRQFQKYDRMATEASRTHRQALYFRSILPFIATVFLFFGSYAESVIGFWLHVDVRVNLLGICAGIGFLLHALATLYGTYLSRKRSIRTAARRFLYARCIAEFLRVALHLLPYGVIVREQSRGEEGKEEPDSPYRCAMQTLRKMLGGLETTSSLYTRQTASQALSSLETLVENQLAYHQRTQDRYRKVMLYLRRLSGAAVWIGFGTVVLRGILQFVLIMAPMQFPGLQAFLGLTRNGLTYGSFVRSSANMLAMLLPAWASYISTKLSLNNFEGLYLHSEGVTRGLRLIQERIAELRARESPSYEVLLMLSEELFHHQLTELTDWHTQTWQRKIEKL